MVFVVVAFTDKERNDLILLLGMTEGFIDGFVITDAVTLWIEGGGSLGIIGKPKTLPSACTFEVPVMLKPHDMIKVPVAEQVLLPSHTASKVLTPKAMPRRKLVPSMLATDSLIDDPSASSVDSPVIVLMAVTVEKPSQVKSLDPVMEAELVNM